jgi:transcriptional regulator with XRE-family HTH domain
MLDSSGNHLGEIIRRQRVFKPLTQHELAAMSGVSPSHLGRIERGERFPSARVLRRIAKPLGFEEDELFALAGYLTPQSPGVPENDREHSDGQLDPYVASVLGREPVEVQRAVIGILAMLKQLARTCI